MRTVSEPAIAAGLVVAALAAGCATTASSSRAPATAPRLGELPPYTAADVEFMSGMIAHQDADGNFVIGPSDRAMKLQTLPEGAGVFVEVDL